VARASGINSLIPLAGERINFGDAVTGAQRIASNRELLTQQRRANEQGQRAADEQEFVRELKSVVDGAELLAPFLAENDLQGARRLLTRRREMIGGGGGFNGTGDTDEALALLDRAMGGDQQALGKLQSDVATTIQLGRQFFGVPKPELRTLSPGTVLVDESGNQVAAAPFKPESGFTLGEGQARFGADGRQIASVAAQPEQPSNSDILRNRQGVRTVIDRVRKDSGVADIVPNAKLFDKAINRGTGAGDVVAIIALAKLLDPGSVVREGEVDIIQRGDGIFGQLAAKLGQIREGGQVLSETQRAELAALAQDRLTAAAQDFRSRLDVERQGFEGFIDPTFLDSQFNQDPFAGAAISVQQDTLQFDDGTTVTFK
jgi:hypothetical protein